MAKEGDSFLAEYAAYNPTTPGIFGWQVIADKTAYNSATYDQVLPQNNPSGTKGYIHRLGFKQRLRAQRPVRHLGPGQPGPNRQACPRTTSWRMKIPGSVIRPNEAGCTTKQMDICLCRHRSELLHHRPHGRHQRIDGEEHPRRLHLVPRTATTHRTPGDPSRSGRREK